MSRLTQPARIQLWLDRLNRQVASRLTVAEFCRREAVSVPSFVSVPQHHPRRMV